MSDVLGVTLLAPKGLKCGFLSPRWEESLVRGLEKSYGTILSSSDYEMDLKQEVSEAKFSSVVVFNTPGFMSGKSCLFTSAP